MNQLEDLDELEGEPQSARGLYLALAATVAVVAAALLWLAGPAPVTEMERFTAPPPIATRAPSPFAEGPAVLGPDRIVEEKPAVEAKPDTYRGLMEKFSASVRKPKDPQLRSLAVTLNAGLNEQVKNHSLDPDEALVLKAAVLDVLETNSIARSRALLAWMRSQEAFHMPVDEADEVRANEYKLGEAAIVAAWQGQLAKNRDPEELERQLEQLLLKAFEEPEELEDEPDR